MSHWNFKKHFIAASIIILGIFIFNAVVSTVSPLVIGKWIHGFNSSQTNRSVEVSEPNNIDEISQPNSSIAIIGGTDGPTAIFVSNSPINPLRSFVAYILLLSILLSLYFPFWFARKRGRIN